MLTIDFWLPVLVVVAINALAATGVYVTLMSGQLSVGHAALMGVGGYCAAIMTTRLDLPLVLGLAVGVVVTAVLGGLLAVVTLRMDPLVMGLTTLGFGETLRVVALNTPYVGGAQGFSGIPLDTNLSLALTCLGLGLIVTWRLERSAVGLAARAVRDNPATASAVGVNVARVRILTFAVGAALTGLAGGVSAHWTLLVLPSDLGFFHSLTLLVFVLFGGSRSMWGPTVGALVLTPLPELLRGLLGLQETLVRSGRWIIYGLMIAVIVILRPDGVLGRRRRHRRSRERPPPTSSIERHPEPAAPGAPGPDDRDHDGGAMSSEPRRQP